MKRQKIKLIYILGNSRSGSTILSIFLGLHPRIHYVGELKLMERSYKNRTCNCGEKAEDCSFWGPFIEENLDVFNRPIESDNGLYRFISTVTSIIGGERKSRKQYEDKLLRGISQKVHNEDPSTEMILDSSKSLKRFIMLKQIEDVEIYPVYITRDLRSNLASFVKRGKGFFSSYIRIKVNHWLTQWYLSRKDIKYHSLKYEQFAENPEQVRNRILEYLGLETVDDNEKSIKDIHLISGSTNTIKDFKGKQSIKLQKERNDVFSSMQHRILSWMKL